MICYFSSVLNMFEAIKHNDIREIEELINNGVDVNIQDNYERTPLHYAKNYDVAKLLLEHDADVNAQDGHDDTPLHCTSGYDYD